MIPLIPHIASTESLLTYIASGPHTQPDWTKVKETVTLETEGCLAFIHLPSERLASTDGKTIKIWNEKKQCVATLSGNSEDIHSLIQLSEEHLASVGEKTIKIWNVTSGECVGILRSADVIIPLSDRRLACMRKFGGGISIYGIDSMTFPTPIDETRIFFLGLLMRRMIVGDEAKTIVCHKQSEHLISDCFLPGTNKFHFRHMGEFQFIIQLSDSQLATASEKIIKIWDLTSLKKESTSSEFRCVEILKGFSAITSLVRLSKNKLAVGDNKTIIIVNLGSQKSLLLGKHRGYVWNLIRLSKKLLASSDGETIKIWDLTSKLATAEGVNRVTGCEAVERCLDGCLSDSGDDKSSDDETDLTSNKIALQWDGHLADNVIQLDSGQLIYRSGDTIKIWDVTSHQCVGSFDDTLDLVQLSNAQLASRDAQGALKLLTYEQSPNIKAFAKVLNTLTDRGKNVMVSCLDAMKKAQDQELMDSFYYILEKSREWIVNEFDSILKNTDSLLTIKRIQKMLKRVVCTSDIPFPCILIHMAHESGKFTLTELGELDQIFIDSLTHVADNYIYSSECKTRFNLLLDSVCQQGKVKIDNFTKGNLENKASATFFSNDLRFKELQQRLNKVELKISNLNVHVIELQDYVNENVKLFQAQLNELGEAIRQKEKISTIASSVNIAVSIIPLIGPVTKAVGDTLINAYSMLLSLSHIDPALNIIKDIPKMLQDNTGSIIKQVGYFAVGQLIDAEEPLQDFANQIPTPMKPFESAITNVDRPGDQAYTKPLQISVSNRLPLQFAKLFSPDSNGSSPVSSKDNRRKSI